MASGSTKRFERIIGWVQWRGPDPKQKPQPFRLRLLLLPLHVLFCVGPIAPEGAAGRIQVLGVPIDRSSSMGW